MKRRWWRRLAQRIAYPKCFPTCFAFWNPKDGETFPPRIGITFNGASAWYRLEGKQP